MQNFKPFMCPKFKRIMCIKSNLINASSEKLTKKNSKFFFRFDVMIVNRNYSL